MNKLQLIGENHFNKSVMLPSWFLSRDDFENLPKYQKAGFRFVNGQCG